MPFLLCSQKQILAKFHKTKVIQFQTHRHRKDHTKQHTQHFLEIKTLTSKKLFVLAIGQY